MTQKFIPRLAAFPQSGDIWRINWLGELSYPDRGGVTSQPSVLVHLSRLTNQHLYMDPAEALNPQFAEFGIKQLRRWVSVGALPFLRVGDIWQNQELIFSPEYEIECFNDLEIKRDAVKLIKSGVSINGDDEFIIPFSEHPWHMGSTNAYCVLIELSGNKRLLIPCLELIRFYFGSSSRLISSLFIPPLKKESLFKEYQFNERNKHLRIILGEGISGVSASDVGRIAVDPVAWHSASLIAGSILKNSITQESINVQSIFPFEGFTDLVCSGKWLSFSGQQKQTFLVYSLRSCSHSFPFTTLEYVAERVKNKKPKDDTPNEKESDSILNGGQQSPSSELLKESDGSKLLIPNKRVFDGAIKFPDLKNKKIWKEDSSNDTTQAGEGRGKKIIKEGLVSVGAPSGYSSARSIDLNEALESPDSKKPPKFLEATLQALKKEEYSKVTLLSKSEEDDWTVPCEAIFDEEGVIDEHLFLESDANKRFRRVSIFEVAFGGNSKNIAVLENEPSFIKCEPNNPALQDRIQIFSYQASKEFVAIKKDSQISSDVFAKIQLEALQKISQKFS